MKRVAGCFPIVAVPRVALSPFVAKRAQRKKKSEKQAKDKDRMHGPKAFLSS